MHGLVVKQRLGFITRLRCFMPNAVIRRFSMQCARHGWQSVTQSKAQRQPLADPLAHHITMQQQQQQQACVRAVKHDDGESLAHDFYPSSR